MRRAWGEQDLGRRVSAPRELGLIAKSCAVAVVVERLKRAGSSGHGL